MKSASVAGAKPLPATLVPCTQDRDWPVYDWAKRHAAVTKIAADRKASVVFIGDSITQMFGGEPHDRSQPGKDVWEKYYGKRNAANLGFGYDFTPQERDWRERGPLIWKAMYGRSTDCNLLPIMRLGCTSTNTTDRTGIAALEIGKPPRGAGGGGHGHGHRVHIIRRGMAQKRRGWEPEGPHPLRTASPGCLAAGPFRPTSPARARGRSPTPSSHAHRGRPAHPRAARVADCTGP